MSKVVSRVLFECGIPHKTIIGTVLHKSTFGEIPYHQWISLGTGEIVDFKLSMWLDADSLPVGLFEPAEHQELLFVSRAEIDSAPSAFIADILSDGKYVAVAKKLKELLQESKHVIDETYSSLRHP